MSLFDEFANTSSGGDYSVKNYSSSSPILLEPGYVSTGVLNDQLLNILTLDRVQFNFPGIISYLLSCSNIVAVSMEGAIGTALDKSGGRSQKVMRIDVGQPDVFDEIEITFKQKKDRIRKLFLDPTGNHMIITSDAGENLYLYSKWKKPRILSKFKGVLINSIAWGRPKGGPGDSTGVFLLGSLQGHIYEAELQATDEIFKREEKFFRQVYTVPDSMPVYGIRYEKFPVTSSRKHVVFIATPERLYQLVGFCGDQSSEIGMFGDFFRAYDEIPGHLINGELHFWSPFLEGVYPSIPKDFAWLTEPGIYYGRLSFGNQNAGDNVVDNAQLLPYPPMKQSNSNGITIENSQFNDTTNEVPLSIALTQFHFVLLYADRVKGVNALSGEVVYEEQIPLKPGEKVVGMTSDAVQHTHWVYTTETLFELLVTEEDRDMWKLYLDRKSFDAALTFAKNEAQRDKILTTQAEYYFSQGRYQLSASYYAQSMSLTFEDI
ncbi:hypothetical protein HK096_001163, partial [Nowakowskiella sp. JEL0078]